MGITVKDLQARFCIIINTVSDLYLPIILRNINEVKKIIHEFNAQISVKIIVVRNAKLASILQEKARYDWVDVIFIKKPINLAQGRNLGVKMCKAEWVVFIDDDVVMSKEFLRRLMILVNVFDRIKKVKVVGIAGNSVPLLIFKHNKRINMPFFRELYWLLGCTYYDFPDNRLKIVERMIGSCMIIKREVFEKIGLFNENLGFFHVGKKTYIVGEDTELSLRINKSKVGIIVYDPKLVVYHVIFPNKLHPMEIIKRAFFYPLSLKIFLHTSGYKERTAKDMIKEYGLKLIKKCLKAFKKLVLQRKKEEFSKIITAVLIAITLVFGFIYAFSKVHYYIRKLQKCSSFVSLNTGY